MNRYPICRLLAAATTLLLASPGPAQDLLKAAPGYARYQALSRGLTNDAGLNAVSVTWREGGKSFDYSTGGKRLHFDIASQTTALASSNTPSGEGRRRSGEDSGRRSRPPAPGRGRQYSSATSPDGKWKAFYRERNLWLSETNNTNAVALTTDGNLTNRVKNGSASWVYGEELRQSTAIWWSSNSQKVAFYRFDESKVRDYYLTLDLTNLQSREFAEAYPKAGTTNPSVDILVYDLPTKRTAKLDVRDGQPFDNETIGHYVYGISWSPDSREVLFRRTNRKQNIQEFCAGDPETGKSRVIIREEWPASWVENLLPFQFLKDGQRFLWASDRNGWRNYYLYNLKGELLATVTAQKSDCGDIVHVDEEAGQVYYLARTGDNPLKLQLHCVGLDGKNDERLTDPAFHHTIDFAPDGKHYIDVAQTHNIPPSTCLMDNHGRLLTELRHGDLAEFKKQKLRAVELFKFKAADGQTDLYGMLHFPSKFSSWKKYPLLVTVYAGPETSGAREAFTIPNSLTELGFLVASLDSRSANGRGKHALDVIYQHLGTVEIDDQAAGVKALTRRHYVDANRVGIFGTSYGGTASGLCLLRYPGTFQAACSCSPVTDFRNYDTIYTERYFGLPQEGEKVYDAASLMTYIGNLQGRWMLYYGTADDNVHPSNMMQLVKALQHAGRNFELQAGPDLGHTSLNRDRMMEFFIASLPKR